MLTDMQETILQRIRSGQKLVQFRIHDIPDRVGYRWSDESPVDAERIQKASPQFSDDVRAILRSGKAVLAIKKGHNAIEISVEPINGGLA